MDDKFSRKPAFQQPSSNSRFATKPDRSGEKRGWKKREKGDQAEGGNRTSTRRDRDIRSNDRDGQSDRERRLPRHENTATAHIWGGREMNASKAGKHSSGSVKVVIAGEIKGEKKTGALSPRAPEKIRKNRNEEMKVYGEAACRALFSQRPESIVRLWATVEMSHRIGEIMSYLAGQKKAYHVVDSAELELVSGSEHHAGICMLVKKAKPIALSDYLKHSKLQDCVLLLDDIQNAHNLGSVIRTAVYYGVKGIACQRADMLYSPAAARVAEGGMEYMYALESADHQTALIQLKQAGYQIIELTSHKQAQPLNKVELTDKVVFVLSETVQSTLNPQVDHQVVLSFENPLHSGLNVAVNAGILLSAWYFR